MIQMGQKYRVVPAFVGTAQEGKHRKQTGTVVWSHPRGRYAVLEFEGVSGKPREGFHPVDLEGKRVD